MTDLVTIVGEKDVDHLATTGLALAAARDTAEIVASGRLTTGRLQVQDDVIWSRTLFGILPALDLIGYKEFHRVGKQVHYHVHLFRRSTGEALGIVDGRRITSLRTAATAAVAIAHHWRASHPAVVAVIGSGEEATEGLRMLVGALSVADAKVFSPTASNREAFARSASAEHGIAVTPVTSMVEAFEGADVAYIATSAAGDPFVRAADLKGLVVVAAIGSTRPDQRELVGDAVAASSHVVVDCADALKESGDLIEAVEYGFDAGRAVLLGDDLQSEIQRREGPILFKSIGSVEQDIVLADYLMRAATEQGLGRRIKPIASVRIMR